MICEAVFDSGKDSFMEEKTLVPVEPKELVPTHSDKTGFMRKYLKTIITVILLAAILITSGIYVIDRKAEIEGKQSSFKLTTFDYVITSPTKAQVEEFSANPAVSKIFPCYNFEITANGGYRFPVLMCDSLEGYEISLFNEDTCVSGKVDASGIMLDETAAERLNVKVGDSVSFAMGGKAVSLKVSGIYMASTYNGLNKGLGLAVFTPEMKTYFPKEITYKLAFIDAADTAACQTMLNGYIPMGELVPEADYTGPNYADYKDKFLKGDHSIAVQVKANYMKDVVDQIETRDSDVTYISVILGIASFIAYAALGIVFICMNRRDDEISLAEGVPHSKMLKEYMLSNTVGALFVAVVTGVVLLIVAAVKNHFMPCLPIVLLSALPILPAAIVVALFAKSYLGKLYAVGVDRGDGDNNISNDTEKGV